MLLDFLQGKRFKKWRKIGAEGPGKMAGGGLN